MAASPAAWAGVLPSGLRQTRPISGPPLPICKMDGQDCKAPPSPDSLWLCPAVTLIFPRPAAARGPQRPGEGNVASVSPAAEELNYQRRANPSPRPQAGQLRPSLRRLPT